MRKIAGEGKDARHLDGQHYDRADPVARWRRKVMPDNLQVCAVVKCAARKAAQGICATCAN